MRKMWSVLGMAAVLGLAVGGCRHAAQRERGEIVCSFEWDFSKSPVGKPPSEMEVALTGGGPQPVWVVREDPAIAPKRAVVQESKDDTSYRFPLLIAAYSMGEDVWAETRFKSISGTVDQAAGVVVRYTPENYYVARANPLEDNVNLFRVINGKRDKLVEVPAKVPLGEWHTIKLMAEGSRLTVFLDDKVVIEHTDDKIKGEGRVGLWTKADSVTAFTDLKARRLR